jgi:diguanylate cyclase (GGDEF)-like protein
LAHWTEVLTNVSTVEFVLLAALTLVQWLRHRIRGAGWAACAFAILGGISLVAKIHPSFLTDERALKVLVALLMLMPYCLFRFSAAFRRPSRTVRYAAAAMTAAIIVLTFSLQYVPVHGSPPPPHFAVYRAAFLLQFAFIVTYVVVRLFWAGTGEPRIAAIRMHLLALAVAGLEAQVVLAALGIRGDTVAFADQIVTVVMGLLFLTALVLPSFIRLFLSRHEDQAFRRAMTELVTAGRAKDVAEGLLPHVCALVGASKGALLGKDRAVLARYPALPADDERAFWNGEDESGTLHRVPLHTPFGESHELVVVISPYMPYFGTEELHKLDQLAEMLGLALERCEMAEQMAYQASHDALTGLANRVAFVDRLSVALSHVGRRSPGLAVLFIDLDRFKLVNDRADHGAGDTVLQEMSRRLTGAVRRIDLVARFGGDEFVAFAEVNSESEAVELAERFRGALAAPFSIGDMELRLTASVGVVVTGDGSDTSEALLHDADTAMYEAKHAGRDQVVLFHSTARTVANARWGLGPTRAERLGVG